MLREIPPEIHVSQQIDYKYCVSGVHFMAEPADISTALTVGEYAYARAAVYGNALDVEERWATLIDVRLVPANREN